MNQEEELLIKKKFQELNKVNRDKEILPYAEQLINEVKK